MDTTTWVKLYATSSYTHGKAFLAANFVRDKAPVTIPAACKPRVPPPHPPRPDPCTSQQGAPTGPLRLTSSVIQDRRVALLLSQSPRDDESLSCRPHVCGRRVATWQVLKDASCEQLRFSPMAKVCGPHMYDPEAVCIPLAIL